MTYKLSTYSRNTLASAHTALYDSAAMKCYSGSQPASPQDAATGTLLATITFSATAEASVDNGVSAFAVPVSGSASAAGTLGWARVEQGGNVIADGTLSLSGGGGDFIVAGSTLDVAIDDIVNIVAQSITQPAQ